MSCNIRRERERDRQTVYQALDTSISCLLCEQTQTNHEQIKIILTTQDKVSDYILYSISFKGMD